jgi:hypothetical protein
MSEDPLFFHTCRTDHSNAEQCWRPVVWRTDKLGTGPSLDRSTEHMTGICNLDRLTDMTFPSWLSLWDIHGQLLQPIKTVHDLFKAFSQRIKKYRSYIGLHADVYAHACEHPFNRFCMYWTSFIRVDRADMCCWLCQSVPSIHMTDIASCMLFFHSLFLWEYAIFERAPLLGGSHYPLRFNYYSATNRPLPQRCITKQQRQQTE